MTIEQPPTTWGRTRFGTGRTPAMAIAVPLGILIGIAGGLLAVVFGVAGAQPLVGFLSFAAFLTFPGIAVVFAVVVDRETLKGATQHPDDSVESGWYDRATSGTFHDIIVVLGVTSLVLAFIPRDFQVDLKLVLPAVLALCFVSTGIRYLLLRRKG
ncbi:hypothetical protein [Nesterenkonia sp. AN1]|uniref:hypothetical protein n=1 Tax=Nesterenkonia sp. AN1 TaxID=652017 RepID=UPI0012683B3F|nr:hypothetical protein [Nesterenkonia sp. AN1]